MLSILIPTYNYDCRDLVNELRHQATGLQLTFEILVADDCSADEYKNVMREVNQWPCCRFLEMDHNVGRAVIRNTLARRATYTYLLFLDADAGVSSPDFLANYLKQATEIAVLYGGLIYPAEEPPVGMRLRYYYGVKKEQLTLAQRCSEPYQKFNSISFLVPKALFLTVLFDESFVAYGHEDTRFGMDLRQRGIEIHHIDNPVVHYNQDSDEEFLRKTRTAVRVLYDKREVLEEASGLLRTLKRLESWNLVFLTALFFRFSHTHIERRLSGKKPSISLFSFYKLGYLCSYSFSSKRKIRV